MEFIAFGKWKPAGPPFTHVVAGPVPPDDRSGLLQRAVNRQDASPDGADRRVVRSRATSASMHPRSTVLSS